MYALLADLLTLSRIVAAGALVWLGLRRGPDALTLAAAVTVLGWTSDQLDGWAARRSATRTRLGPYDFVVDVVFYAGIATYLVTAQFVPWRIMLAFVALSMLAWAVTRRKAIAILCIRMVDIAAGVVLFRYAPWVGALIVGWLAVLAVIYRRRLTERVPRWGRELRSIVRKKPEPPSGAGQRESGTNAR